MVKPGELTPLNDVGATPWGQSGGEPMRPPFVLLQCGHPRSVLLEPSVARYLAHHLIEAADQTERDFAQAVKSQEEANGARDGGLEIRER